ncbi:MAG: 4-alpha-glucanotransferase, partial [Muribaculaceae bacterium]|nr:4-alpha-glucanotransferase [Muribaculaceae bacterium]
MPVFSLRSENDFGVGDFADLKLLADWAKATGQSFIQILPVNDTTMSRTNADSYPYNANSTFALHPMYLRIEELGTPSRKADRERFKAMRIELQALPAVDYTAVIKAKEEYSRLIFAEQGEKTLASPEFAEFVAGNASWLLPYAAWCVLRDRYRTPDFSQWGTDARFSQATVVRLLITDTAEMEYHMYIQFHLDRQLREAHTYANSIGVALKGDIPIGISRCSADAWQHPELFNLGMQAGAPPDDFAVLGQNWGFPIYNWPRMAADGYAWWRQRLSKMAEYFDAYRIDHVLGFFRIWQIPVGAVHGLLGHFYPAMPLSADDMQQEFGFTFSEQMLAPGADTKGFASQLAAAESGDDAAADAFDDVLFVADSEQPLRYHPRIAAQKTSHYRSLSDDQRRAFDRLYEEFYYHRHNEFWRHKAMEKLPALVGATTMLPCAEDLGMIPASVPSVLADLQILSLEVQRMPKEYGREFGHPAGYPYMSVCT